MKKYFIRFALWLLRKCAYAAPVLNERVEIPLPSDLFRVPDSVKILLPSAKNLCAEADRYDYNGEWKRHRVYAKILKQLPGSKHKDVALAIELALAGYCEEEQTK